MPEVSVIMGVHNGARFLPATLASVYAQTFTDWELVIVDNGSTDGGLAAALGPAPDPRVRVFTHAKALSPGGALAEACSAARGRYLAVLDSDDLSAPRRLELQRAYLDLRPEVLLLGAASDLIDEDGRPLGREPLVSRHEDILALTAYVHVLRHSGVMFRRELLERIHYRLMMGFAEDQDFFARAAELGPVEALPVPLCLYRLHSGNHSRRGPLCAVSRAFVVMATQRRRRGQPEDLEHWQRIFAGIEPQAGNNTGRTYVAVARIFQAENMPDVAALYAWEAMRTGARWAGLRCYLRATLGGLGRARHVAVATARAWLKEPAHQLLRAGGVPDRPQF